MQWTAVGRYDVCVTVTAGLGALVLRRSLLPVLQKHKAYFGGGTVEVVLPDSPYVVRCVSLHTCQMYAYVRAFPHIPTRTQARGTLACITCSAQHVSYIH